jgi:hypothetical protein
VGVPEEIPTRLVSLSGSFLFVRLTVAFCLQLLLNKASWRKFSNDGERREIAAVQMYLIYAPGR